MTHAEAELVIRFHQKMGGSSIVTSEDMLLFAVELAVEWGNERAAFARDEAVAAICRWVKHTQAAPQVADALWEHRAEAVKA